MTRRYAPSTPGYDVVTFCVRVVTLTTTAWAHGCSQNIEASIHFQTEGCLRHSGAVSSKSHDAYIAIWAKAVETQMHFNEMSVKSRQLGLTFVAAALGVGVVLLSQGRDYSLGFNFFGYPIDLHITVLLVLGALLAIVAVKGLDLNVYHKMLRGAVTFGEDFEENYMKEIFSLEKGMTQAISHYSRFQDANVTRAANGRYQYRGVKKITAEDKIRRFYSSTILFLCVAAFGLFVATNLTTWTGANKTDVQKVPDRQTQTSPNEQ